MENLTINSGKKDSNKDQDKSIDKEKPLSIEEKSELFLKIILEKVFSTVNKDLLNSGFNQEDVDYLINKLDTEYSSREAQRFLALPYSARKFAYKKFASEMIKKDDRGERNKVIDKMLDYYINNNLLKNTYFAFHNTNSDIHKVIEGPQKREEWYVKGDEKDHRNSDLPMAYYSMNFKDLFFRGPMKYLYLVRANLDKDYKDNDGSWGRAYSLPIIDRFDLQEIMSEINKK